MKAHVCTKCGNKKRFYATAHVVQEWIVDEDGEYIDTYDDCVVVAHYPDDDDIWYCAECGEEVEVIDIEDGEYDEWFYGDDEE